MARKLVIIMVNTDPRNGEELGAPFFQATVAAAMDYEVEVICTATAGQLMKRGVAEKLVVKPGSPKTVYDFIKDAHQAGVKFYCCSPNLDLFDMTEADLIPECSGIVGGAHVIEEVMENDEARVLTYLSCCEVRMAEASAAIGDPVSGSPVIAYEKLEEVFEDIRSHALYDHELHGCLNCGICTATCPSAHYYDYSPREIVQLLWTENLEGIYEAMQEKIWSCAQCYTCAARCPFENSPGGLVMIMREVAIKHGMQSAKDVLRPFSRVLLKIISTGNQLAPNMITRDAFPDWGPNVSKVEAPLNLLRKAIPMPTMHTTDTAWEVNLKTSIELYTIWEETGVLQQLETIDENLFDVITDVMDEKRNEYAEWLEEQKEEAEGDE